MVQLNIPLREDNQEECDGDSKFIQIHFWEGKRFSKGKSSKSPMSRWWNKMVSASCTRLLLVVRWQPVMLKRTRQSPSRLSLPKGSYQIRRVTCVGGEDVPHSKEKSTGLCNKSCVHAYTKSTVQIKLAARICDLTALQRPLQQGLHPRSFGKNMKLSPFILAYIMQHEQILDAVGLPSVPRHSGQQWP